MNTMPDPDDFVLVMTVGGSPDPLVKSIKHYKPKYAIFIVSKGSHSQIQTILDETGSFGHFQTINLADEQNILQCVRDIRAGIPQKLHELSLPPDILLIADITGGTKAMSASLAMVMVEHKSRFSYVGGDKRTKENGLGIVESGHEKMVTTLNPWDAIGLREAQDLIQAYNTGHYPVAVEKANFLKSTDSEYSIFYEGLSRVIDGIANWDIFNYEIACSGFRNGVNRLKVYNTRTHPKFQAFFSQLEQLQAELEAISTEYKLLHPSDMAFKPLPAGTGSHYLRDLVANAQRCAERGHYDDAVARLYSAVEKAAKIALAQRGIDNSNVPPELLDRLDEEFSDRYKTQEKIQFALQMSYKALCALAPDEPMSKAFIKYEKPLTDALDARNHSLLAHGYQPIRKSDYDKLNEIVMCFLELDQGDLLQFPKLELNQVLF